MAQNIHNNKNPRRSTDQLSPSRSISTIPNHQNKISFMPKFLLKTLRKKKKNHSRSISISDNNHNEEKIRRIDKHVHDNNHHLPRLKTIPKRVNSIMSVLFRKKKSIDQEKSKDDHRSCSLEQRSSEGHRSSDRIKSKTIQSRRLSSSLSFLGSFKKRSCSFGVGDFDVVSAVSDGITTERKKGGLKIKRIIKIKRKDKGEKRFELCKKKILMGEKCRPLSGSLHYDKHGVFVPEDVSV